MGGNNVRQKVLQLAATASLLWLSGAHGGLTAPASCDDLMGDWQTMLVSGQSSANYTAQLPCGLSCPPPSDGKIFVCFNPQENCYLAGASAPFGSLIPFMAETMGESLDVISAPKCGGIDGNTGKRFNVMLTSDEPGSGCLNKLIVTEGTFKEGMLVMEPKGPAIMIGTKPFGLLVDGLPLIGDFVKGGSLNIPGYHMNSMFEVHIPLMHGGIVVRNKDTDEVVARGSVNNTCGARLGGPSVAPIPTLPQYGLMLLAAGLLLAAVRMTRRRMSA